MRNRIKYIAKTIARKNGLRGDLFIETCRTKSPTQMSDNEIDSLFELAMASIITSPDMLEIYLGIKAGKVREIIANRKTIKFFNNSREDLTKREAIVINFLGESEYNILEIYSSLGKKLGTKSNIHACISYMVKKGLLNKVRRGVYSSNYQKELAA